MVNGSRTLAVFILACLLGLPGVDASARKDAGTQSSAVVSSEIAVADLPSEARRTLQLIKQGGPFAYVRDGVTFGNYEKLLPLRERGYYREYTVKTPGISSRGARRIIVGRGGELYYTADHYASFRRIQE